MTRSWVPDPGWTGDWELPDVLTRPIDTRERGALVAMSLAGMGPHRLARALRSASCVGEVAGSLARDGLSALDALAALDARAVVPSDDEYPFLLRTIPAPPPLLFVRGAELNGLQPAVAVVGSRACTSGAKRFARRLGEAFALAGFTVVSGLARGIDGAAHLGAVDAGRTVAVLGTGLDVCYPAEHRELAARVVEVGALVTEFPPGIGPRAWHFPARNRIISGLCIALVVVEAGVGSGALITAGFALEQGRDVFACTTGPENPAGAGVREMLRDGARLIVDSEQAVEDMVEVAKEHAYSIETLPIAREERDVGRLTADLRVIYESVTEDTTAEQVAAATDLPVGRVSAVLSELELEGFVDRSSGRWRRRT